MLLLDSSKRLSIDIDILISEPGVDAELFFPAIIREQSFLRFELQQRQNHSGIQKVHYKFYYNSVSLTAAEDFVLLDIVFEKNNYRKILELPIRSKFMLNTGGDITVLIPSAEDLLGDKLTAFAPNTTGIPYQRSGNSMSMEIIKQLYDIGTLFEFVAEPEIIRDTFYRFAQSGISLRNLAGVNFIHVADDIYNTALCLSLRGAGGIGNFHELQQGIRRVSRFIFSESYHTEKAIVRAARTAYLARLAVSQQQFTDHYTNPLQIAEFQIQPPHNTKLQKLKKSSPEAFYYWYLATRMQSAGE